jgi:methylase of polypeptide subunit release factors
LWKSILRVSNLYLPHAGSSRQHTFNAAPSPLYFHSAFPTTASDSVFFGPDTYFFLDFLTAQLPQLQASPRCIVDVCCGSGAGAIHLAKQFYPSSDVVGLDMNTKALELGLVNAAIADCRQITFLDSDLFAAISSRTDVDVIVTNPPYIATSNNAGPVYSDGGGQQGLGLPLRIVEEGMRLLAEGGYLLIYTGVPIMYRRPGHDVFRESLEGMSGQELVSYVVLVADYFGEELSAEAYGDVGRIQLVGAVMRKV